MDETAALLLDPTTEPDVSRFSVHQDQGTDPYLALDYWQDPADYPARPRVASPQYLQYPPGSIASSGGGSGSPRRSRQRRKRYVSETGAILSAPDSPSAQWISLAEQDPILEASPMFLGPRHPTRYPKRFSIRRRRAQCCCPPSCEPARLASLYDDLPFTYTITLDTVPGGFLEAWNAWDGPSVWTASVPVEYPPVWLGSVAREISGLPRSVVHRYRDPQGVEVEMLSPITVGHVHCHLVVGNVPYADLMRGLATWPGRFHVERIRNAKGGKWGAIHYALAQDTPLQHRSKMGNGQQPEDRQYEYGDSYCHNVLQHVQSANLEWFAYLTRRQILRTASRRASSKSATWRRERARKAARARWGPKGGERQRTARQDQ